MGILRKALIVGTLAVGAARLKMGKRKFDRTAHDVKGKLEKSLNRVVKPAVKRAIAKGRRRLKAAAR